MKLIGQPIVRLEDARFLRGFGSYTDDQARPDAAYLHVLRSPHAHAIIISVDVCAAQASLGVLMVATGADYVAADLGCPHTNTPALGPLSRLRGPIIAPPNLVLARDRTRYVGEPVAFVVAGTPAQARDAAERIVVAYEPLPSVTDLDAATADHAPLIWEQAPRNICADMDVGDADACSEAFANAAHIVTAEVINNRIYGCPMEPRNAVADHDPATGKLTLTTGHQLPNPTRDSLARVLQMPPEDLRVISPDMGGGFGVRSQTFPENIFLLWAAGTLQRSVRWRGDRTESFLSDAHARESLWHGELALDAAGKILGLRIRTVANLGAYPGHAGALVPLSAGPRVLTGAYDIPALDAHVTVVATNTMTVAPYRGAGQPEAIYLLERLMDEAARQTGIDRVIIRRRNLKTAKSFAAPTAAGATYDSGDYADAMTRALRRADWDGFPARRAAALARHRLAGIGIANYVQAAAGAPAEWGSLTVAPAGKIAFRVGTHSHGQGHATTYAQIVADQLGLPIDQIALIEGDTSEVLAGNGTHGSRSLFKAADIALECAAGLIRETRHLAADRFGVDPEHVTYADGELRTKASNDVLTLADFPGLSVDHHYNSLATNYPSGTHICEIEIDPETGALAILRYTAVDDAGRLINPLISRGQMHGGIVQGLGQAAFEHIIYQDGQLLTASFQDYAIPRADDVPDIDVTFQEVASPTNKLGIKGIGESGPTGSPPALISAILDALAPLDIHHIDMPATPENIWRSLGGRTGLLF
jgi:carbon-monoxide dehydrogenase large subunit